MFSVNRPQNPIKKVRISAIFRGTSKRLIHNLFKIQAGTVINNNISIIIKCTVCFYLSIIIPLIIFSIIFFHMKFNILPY